MNYKELVKKQNELFGTLWEQGSLSEGNDALNDLTREIIKAYAALYNGQVYLISTYNKTVKLYDSNEDIRNFSYNYITHSKVLADKAQEILIGNNLFKLYNLLSFSKIKPLNWS